MDAGATGLPGLCGAREFRRDQCPAGTGRAFFHQLGDGLCRRPDSDVVSDGGPAARGPGAFCRWHSFPLIGILDVRQGAAAPANLLMFLFLNDLPVIEAKGRRVRLILGSIVKKHLALPATREGKRG